MCLIIGGETQIRIWKHWSMVLTSWMLSLEIQSNIENLVNSLRKNNIRLQDLKEGLEGDNLIQYLKKRFTDCLGADSDIIIWIVAAYQICSLKKTDTKNLQVVLIKFSDWVTKRKVQDTFQHQSNLVVEGAQILVFPDLCAITVFKKVFWIFKNGVN